MHIDTPERKASAFTGNPGSAFHNVFWGDTSVSSSSFMIRTSLGNKYTNNILLSTHILIRSIKYNKKKKAKPIYILRNLYDDLFLRKDASPDEKVPGCEV